MSNLMKNFFAELVKSTTFTTKVSIVKTTLHEWLCEQVYPDPVFRLKLQKVVHMFVMREIDNAKIHKLVETVDSSKKLSPHQIDYLINAFLNNCSVKLILQRFVQGDIISDDELSFMSTFLVRQMDEAYQLPHHHHHHHHNNYNNHNHINSQ
ncbi:ORF-67 [Catopsilia pomona nucleopolyhedrovirus]|uniref:ORF-67 n=1 Tax=Catopsilia pomona nucleopolyhedrovirus TaxID=1850906 RepID=A0A172WZE0_9ABAC|nr:ORF-67 [Catopsilia pomona nucleopolyhedrovirus]ANF29715.1 ORF-67 [Catopsilia pomona nucleopolyhedrovirus]